MDLDASHGRAAAALSVDRAGGGRIDVAGDHALRALARLGFVQPADRNADRPAWRWRGEDAAGDRALLRLLATFDLQVEVGPAADGSAWIALAMRRPATL